MRIIHSQTTPSRITLFSSTARITLFSVTSRITFLINCENYSLLSNFENHFSHQLRELLSFSSNTGNVILDLNSEKASSNLREECCKRLRCSSGQPNRPDGTPTGPDGPPYGPDGRLTARTDRLTAQTDSLTARTDHLTARTAEPATAGSDCGTYSRGWIMSHLYL